MALTEQPGATVALSYRGEVFSRVKPKNRQRAERAVREGRLQLMLGSNLQRIEPGQVRLEIAGQPRTLRSDAVIVCAGGQLPTPLLQKIGVAFETRYGTS